MKCVICKHGDTELSTTTMTLERDGAVVAFKDVPAQVCRNCGEAYVAEEISAKLLGMAEQSVRDGIEVGVRKYAPV
ncbi:MAG: type II toxin-antitoxin system MqsA family antitoxin [Betaproteobacteria bacterium]|jgi:YgiT-type zinc finger domain-containing protein|nr:type II toxin-antitoxin system MqsA family antitoxin [Betaproteobacteria bacterium]